MARKAEFQLNDPPSDYVPSIKFHQNFNQFLLVGSWDNAVRLYDTDINCVRFKWSTSDPIQDSSFMGPMHITYGGFEGVLKIRDANTNVEETVGSHDDGIKKVEFVPKKNVIISGSWDRTIKFWDARLKGNVATYDQCDGKVYSMSVVDEKIAVATSECKALVWDMRNMKKYMILHRLNHRLNCIALSPNKQCYVIGHRDGRVAVEYINRDLRQQRTAFKCHRMRLNFVEYMYDVTAVSFHDNSIFASGGSNGYVNLWDGLNKKRLRQYNRHEMSITALAFSHDGKKLAIACSDWYAFNDPTSGAFIKVRNFDKRKVKPIDQS